MKKLLVLLSILTLNTAYAYEIIGEGHVSEPVIVKNDPAFKVIEGGSAEYLKKKKEEQLKQKKLEELKKKHLDSSME